MAEPAVRLIEVSKVYETKGETIHALDRVSLEILPGEFIAVAGPSGSGKSTLLNLVGGLDTPTGGQILVGSRDLAGMSPTELARMRRDHIGFVFQSYNLIPVLTAIENVEYVMMLKGVGDAERKRRAEEIMAEVGLTGMGARRPAELSGGQQQRVAVARALAAGPTLILADEPTANLDSATGAGLLDMMAEINQTKGATFVFSTHDPRVMERASRLILLRDGRIEKDERR